MISILFIRHGATAGNLEKRYIGRTDETLCDIGISQALNLKKFDFHADYLFVSPMKRTCQTAELIFPQIKYQIIEGFAETDFGIFEGKSAAELAESKEYRVWVDSMCLAPIPSGENVSDFKMRCCRAFMSCMKDIPDNSIVTFVVHGGVIMSILEAYAKPSCGFYDNHIGNGEYIMCEFEAGNIKIKEKL